MGVVGMRHRFDLNHDETRHSPMLNFDPATATPFGVKAAPEFPKSEPSNTFVFAPTAKGKFLGDAELAPLTGKPVNEPPLPHHLEMARLSKAAFRALSQPRVRGVLAAGLVQARPRLAQAGFVAQAATRARATEGRRYCFAMEELLFEDPLLGLRLNLEMTLEISLEANELGAMHGHLRVTHLGPDASVTLESQVCGQEFFRLQPVPQIYRLAEAQEFLNERLLQALEPVTPSYVEQQMGLMLRSLVDKLSH